MGEAKEEAGVEDTLATDDALGDVIRDAQRYCESEKEKAKFDRMLEDHKKLLYPSGEDGQKKSWVQHWSCYNVRHRMVYPTRHLDNY
jgi:hypothetical protein